MTPQIVYNHSLKENAVVIQDLSNKIYYITNNKKFIDSKWNNSDLSSSIIHWSGPQKPWENENEIWMKYKNLYEV